MKSANPVFIGFILASVIFLNAVNKQQVEQNPNVLSSSSTSLFGKFLATKPQTSDTQNIQTELEAAVKNTPGTFSVYILNPYNLEQFSINPDKKYYAASLYKLLVAQAVAFQIKSKEMTLDTRITYTREDFTDGSGTIAATYKFGDKISVDILLDKLLKDSDNIAQNMLVRSLPEISLIEANLLVGKNSTFYSKNIASTVEVSNLLKSLDTQMLARMYKTSFDDRISLGLDSDVNFSHKIGNWGQTGSWHDCGIALNNEKQIIVCVMSENTTFENFTAVSKSVGKVVSKLLN
ncbi:serine hydrolase [Patescibacteria group bacterium]|nr:serine hydrolase [Patescibacteria group bacterium]